MKKTLFIVLGAALLISCGNPKTRVMENARKDIISSLTSSQSFKVLYASHPDSAFGLCSFTGEELNQIKDTATKVNRIIIQRCIGKNGEIDDITRSMSRRQAQSGMSLLNIQSNVGKPKGEWTGWKVKVGYEATDERGNIYRSERWFFFDKDGRRILKSYEFALP